MTPHRVEVGDDGMIHCRTCGLGWWPNDPGRTLPDYTCAGEVSEEGKPSDAALVRVRDLLEELRLMPLGVSRSEAYGIVERWQDDDTGSIRYGRDLAEWIGEEGDETAAKFTELIVLAVNLLPSLLRAYDDQEAHRV